MPKIITDAAGSYDLSQVVAVTPLTYRDGRTKQVLRVEAQLTMASGVNIVTRTDYQTVLKEWQAQAGAAAAPVVQPAAEQPQAEHTS